MRSKKNVFGGAFDRDEERSVWIKASRSRRSEVREGLERRLRATYPERSARFESPCERACQEGMENEFFERGAGSDRGDRRGCGQRLSPRSGDTP